jgi:hypothetical protein
MVHGYLTCLLREEAGEVPFVPGFCPVFFPFAVKLFRASPRTRQFKARSPSVPSLVIPNKTKKKKISNGTTAPIYGSGSYA